MFQKREIMHCFGEEKKLPPISLVLTLPNAKQNSLMKPSGPDGYFEGNILIMNSVISFLFFFLTKSKDHFYLFSSLTDINTKVIYLIYTVIWKYI